MRTSRLLLQDILEAIAEIERYTPDTLEKFNADAPVQSHIVRHIAIIGEAASRLPRVLRDAHPDVPWREIIDMRNIVVHVYHGIN
ncbi:MAG TPA: HepT-like ribonuclease domain-containing protein [Phycisphaerae bacterium]|nr:HepT-like ribonuclease domain-containing protein [Phycisphaerae bacterium]